MVLTGPECRGQRGHTPPRRTAHTTYTAWAPHAQDMNNTWAPHVHRTCTTCEPPVHLTCTSHTSCRCTAAHSHTRSIPSDSLCPTPHPSPQTACVPPAIKQASCAHAMCLEPCISGHALCRLHHTSHLALSQAAQAQPKTRHAEAMPHEVDPLPLALCPSPAQPCPAQPPCLSPSPGP